MQGLAGFVLVHGGRGGGVWAVVSSVVFSTVVAGISLEADLNSEIPIKFSGL